MKNFNRNFCITSLLFIFIFLQPQFLYANDISVEEKVGDFLVNEFEPESILVQATEGGSFMYAKAKGVVIEGVRLDSLSLYALMKSNFAGADIKNSDKYELAEHIYMSRGEVVILEKDVLNYCKKETEDIKGFKDLNIDFTKDFVKISGVYVAKFVFTFNFRLSATAKLSFDSKGLTLTDVKLYINNVEQPESLSKMLVDKINPLIKPNKIPFPVKITDIIMTDDKIIFTGHPKPLKDVNEWRYKR
ncbi:MAG: hypothetical protein RR272_02310 [Synergistaceae bacterium]